MIEQSANLQTEQDETKLCNKGLPRSETRDYHSDADTACEDRQRNGETGAERTHLDLDQTELPDRRKPALVRSKTFDHSLLSVIPTDPHAKIDHKKSHYSQLSKTNSQYHKIFKEICKEELLRQSYTCALQKDILYQGRMFVSDNWICFQSKVFGKDTKIVIPVVSITHIKKTKTAILVPNALVIATSSDRYMFVSFLSRDNTYKFLMTVCLHLEEKSPCSSPVPSANNSFRVRRSPPSVRFPLRFAADFSDLDVSLAQRRRDGEESSSSDSPTPDYERMAVEYPVPRLLEALKQAEQSGSPDLQHQEKSQQSSSCKLPDPLRTGTMGAVAEELLGPTLIYKTISINTLLFIYLLLVCVLVLSSCYMAFRILSLEQTLTTMGSMADISKYQHEYLSATSDVNIELYSELTLNLLKLEKVQRNLQRLLDEAGG